MSIENTLERIAVALERIAPELEKLNILIKEDALNASDTAAPTPAALTPAAPTPAAPTPAAPTPAALTPAAPTPAALTPAAPTPAVNQDDSLQSVLVTEHKRLIGNGMDSVTAFQKIQSIMAGEPFNASTPDQVPIEQHAALISAIKGITV